MKLPHHGRYPFSSIKHRPTYAWPDGKRLAVYFALNIEHFAYGAGRGHALSTELPWPNSRSFAWRDYGNRVGVWRLLDLFDEFQLPACHLINTAVFDYCPEVVDAAMARHDELIGHGRTNSERQGDFWEQDEARLIQDVRHDIYARTGHYPQGWMGPWMSQSATTPDLLQEAGFKYLMDWPCDDQPVWLKTRQDKIMSLPYSFEINDSPQILVRGHSAEEFGTMIFRQFDEMLRQSAQQPLVLGIALHTMIMGQPHRMNVLRETLHKIVHHPDYAQHVWMTRPRDIYAHCMSLPAGTLL
jgi:allantoinase